MTADGPSVGCRRWNEEDLTPRLFLVANAALAQLRGNRSDKAAKVLSDLA